MEEHVGDELIPVEVANANTEVQRHVFSNDQTHVRCEDIDQNIRNNQADGRVRK